MTNRDAQSKIPMAMNQAIATGKMLRHSSRFLLKNKKSNCVLDDTTVMEAN